MKNKVWSMPEAVAEQFMPNEYVAACWGISCDYGENGGNNGAKDPYPNGNNSNLHRKQDEDNGNNGCGHKHSQYIRDTAGGNYELVELDSPTGEGDLRCLIFPDGNYERNGRVGSEVISGNVTDGMTIYWTNTVWNITWHHKGQVEMIDANRTQHS